MADSLAGIVLAAGAGTRLMPLTALRPKALCPVGHRSLLAHALDEAGAATGSLAVNVHHGAEQICAHLADRAVVGEHEVHISHEYRQALGTAGAIGRLRGWLDGRAALVVNADTWHQADLKAFVETCGHSQVSVLTTTPGPFGPSSTVVASLLPGHVAAGLAPVPSGLWEALWRHEVAGATIRTEHTGAVAIDCGTPRDYLAANMRWAALHGADAPGGSVLGDGAVVAGRVERCVVWPDSIVAPRERLVDAIRADGLTVLVR